MMPGVSTGATTLFALLMAIGVVGTLVPVLPGSLLVGVLGLIWAATINTTGGWVVFAVMVLVLVVGVVAKYVLPSRSLAGAGAPRSTIAFGALGAIVGFFVIPVVGLVVGGLLAVYLAELRRLHGARPAWSSTWQTIRAIGLGMAIELLAALTAAGIWAVCAYIFF